MRAPKLLTASPSGVYTNWFDYAEACAWHVAADVFSPCPIYRWSAAWIDHTDWDFRQSAKA